MSPITRPNPSRIELSEPVPFSDVEVLLADPRLRVIQAWEELSATTWGTLNDLFFWRRPDVTVRVYGVDDRDFEFCESLTNVVNFSAECHGQAHGLEALAAMPKLRSLGIHIFSLTEFSVLELVPADLRKLYIGATRSRRPSLLGIGRFSDLRVLYLEGQRKDIEVLACLSHLEDVTLRSITTSDVSFLRGASQLQSFDLKLGGTRNLTALEGLPNVRYLEIWRVLGFDDASLAARLPGLQCLLLQDLPRVTRLPDFAASLNLRRVTLDGLKNLRDFSSLANAPALEELLVIASRCEPGDLEPVLRNPALRRVSAYFGSDRKNRAFKEAALTTGLQPFPTDRRFEFR